MTILIKMVSIIFFHITISLSIIHFNRIKEMLGNPLESVQQSEEHANKGLGDSIFDMDLLSMTVEKILKFNTEREPFNKTYPNTDHLQRFFDEKAITHFAEIITKRYNENKKPVSIVDICCGYGMQIITLREKLTKNGVEIAKIVGYDISKDMIQLAQERNTYWPEVDFERKNIETDFCSVEEFDVAICLFGLQWMNELEPTIQAIHRSLKPGGIFLSLTPIEIHDLFDMRNNFLNYSKWSETFDISARLIHPFHYSKDDYLQPMSKLFKTVHEEKKQTKFNYSREEFLQFLQSWLQEVRHLTNDVRHELQKDAIARAYLSDFIDSIDKNLQGSVIINQDGSVVYTQHTFDFYGEKI